MKTLYNTYTSRSNANRAASKLAGETEIVKAEKDGKTVFELYLLGMQEAPKKDLPQTENSVVMPTEPTSLTQQSEDTTMSHQHHQHHQPVVAQPQVIAPPTDAQIEAANAAATEKAAAKTEVTQNGVKMPKEGTKARELFDLASKMSAEKGAPVTSQDFFDAVYTSGYKSVATVTSVFGQWRKFYGISTKVEKTAEQIAQDEAAKQAIAARKAAREARAATRLEQNGVKRPFSDTKLGAVWDLADSLSAAKGEPVTSKELIEAGVAAGLKKEHCQGEYSLWRKFHGLPNMREAKMNTLEEVTDYIGKLGDRIKKDQERLNELLKKQAELKAAA